jgi:hypothetical protein
VRHSCVATLQSCECGGEHARGRWNGRGEFEGVEKAECEPGKVRARSGAVAARHVTCKLPTVDFLVRRNSFLCFTPVPLTAVPSLFLASASLGQIYCLK